MGLFDKFKTSNNPFEDETTKTYYEMVYGLLSSIPAMSFEGIKKYVEFHSGNQIADETLKQLLRCFAGPLRNGYSKYSDDQIEAYLSICKFSRKKIKGIVALNNELDQSKTYRSTKEQVYDICFKEALQKIESEYEVVLNVVKTNGVKFYEEGVDKIRRKYNSVVGEELCAEHIHNITVKLFSEGNAIVEKIYMAYVCHILKSRKKESQIASVVLRAVHFEKYGKNIDGYETITKDDCRNFVLNNTDFSSQIDEHPYEREKYIDRFTKEIFNSNIALDYKGYLYLQAYFWLPICETERYYSDKLCHKYLDLVSSNYEDPGTALNEIYDMVWDYINED